MNAKKFNLLCVSAVVVVAIFAVAMIQLSDDKSIQAPSNIDLGNIATSESTANPFAIHPLSLPLALAVVLDMGLMTLGLVILFHDEAPRRYRVR